MEAVHAGRRGRSGVKMGETRRIVNELVYQRHLADAGADVFLSIAHAYFRQPLSEDNPRWSAPGGRVEGTR